MKFKTCVTRSTKKDTALYRDRIQSQDPSAVAVLVKVTKQTKITYKHDSVNEGLVLKTFFVS